MDQFKPEEQATLGLLRENADRIALDCAKGFPEVAEAIESRWENNRQNDPVRINWYIEALIPTLNQPAPH